LAALALVAAGCAGRRAAPIGPPSAEGPAFELADRLWREAPASFAARGAANYQDGSAKSFLRFELALRRPGDFSFTVFDPMGRPAYRVVSDGRRLAALDYGTAVCAVAPASAQAFERFMPVKLELAQLMSILTGAPLQAPAAAASAAADDGSVQELRVWAAEAGPDDFQRLELSWEAGEPLLRRLGFGGRRAAALTAAFDGFQPTGREDAPGGGTRLFPRKLTVVWTGDRPRSLEVRYDEVRLGPALNEEIFRVAAPEGFSRVDI
jgi:outer membrane lipoprotein-sorting protein